MNGGRVALYSCAPAIRWVKDGGQTLLVDDVRAESWALGGVEAAVWDLLALGYSYERVVRFLTISGRMSPEQSEAVLLSIVQGWERAGIVRRAERAERVERGGHG